jgi:hypothetical protein
MIDKDERFKYSDVLPVLVDCKTNRINVFPNPVDKGRLYISTNGLGRNAEAVLLSLSGQAIFKIKLLNGTSSFTVANIANGVYILCVNTENGTSKRTKIVIQN